MVTVGTQSEEAIEVGQAADNNQEEIVTRPSTQERNSSDALKFSHEFVDLWADMDLLPKPVSVGLPLLCIEDDGMREVCVCV